MQTIHEAVRLPAGMSTAPDGHEFLVNADRHSLIKNETLAEPMLIPEFLLIRGNPTMQLKHLGKSLASKEC